MDVVLKSHKGKPPFAKPGILKPLLVLKNRLPYFGGRHQRSHETILLNFKNWESWKHSNSNCFLKLSPASIPAYSEGYLQSIAFLSDVCILALQHAKRQLAIFFLFMFCS